MRGSAVAVGPRAPAAGPLREIHGARAKLSIPRTAVDLAYINSGSVANYLAEKRRKTRAADIH